MLSAGTLSRIETFVRSCLSARRYAHSMTTAALAGNLCVRFGADTDKGLAAGLAHDAARELPPGEIVRLCGGDGCPVTGAEARNPILLHGRAAAELLVQRTGFSDPETLQAIRDHVTGRPSMAALSKIVFCADLLEPGRDFIPRKRERMLAMDLDAMTRVVLRSKIRYVRSAREAVSPASKALLKELS
jgi:predicted HD superfamily hydrolase involved in NAD metabolism